MTRMPLGTLPARRSSAGKRAFDLLAGGLLLGLAFPFLVLLAIALGVCDRRNPFRRVETVGRAGIPFQCLRFDASSMSRRRWLSRLTRGNLVLGQRLLSLLQLVHVVSGRMSLVGPRPHQAEKASVLQRERRGYRECLLAAPGLVSPDVLAPPDGNEQARLEFEVLYLRKASVALDLRILGWAAREALKGRPADKVPT